MGNALGAETGGCHHFLRRFPRALAGATLALAVACGGGDGGPDAVQADARDLPDVLDAAGIADVPDNFDARDLPDTADVPDTFVAHPNPKNVPLFDETTVPAFALAFPPDQWTQFLANRAAKVKEYVHCSFTWNGETFADAACRSKSNPDYWGEEKKPQFFVRFNHWDKTGRFHGMRALNLEANPFHSAPIRDRVGMWMFRESGLDASRVNHVTVTVDGAPYGVYMNIEVVDREFLEDHFPDPSGNLFENGSELMTNETTGTSEDLWALEDLVDGEPLAGDHAAFATALAKIVDVPQMLREMAAEAAFPTGDNFTNGGTNYLLYDHPGRGFVVIPWDVDDILCEYGDPLSDPFAYWGHPELELPPGKLRQLVNATPALKAAYVESLKAYRDTWLPKVTARIPDVCAQVRPFVEADPYRASSDMEDFDADCLDAAKRVQLRLEFLNQKLP